MLFTLFTQALLFQSGGKGVLAEHVIVEGPQSWGTTWPGWCDGVGEPWGGEREWKVEGGVKWYQRCHTTRLTCPTWPTLWRSGKRSRGSSRSTPPSTPSTTWSSLCLIHYWLSRLGSMWSALRVSCSFKNKYLIRMSHSLMSTCHIRQHVTGTDHLRCDGLGNVINMSTWQDIFNTRGCWLPY